MARALYTNNATATLAAGILSSDVNITLNTGQGSLFPSLSAGNYFYGTLTDAATGTVIEIVKVTARTSDSLVVARGQQGTTAQAFNANDKFELRVTAGGMSEFAIPADITSAFTGSNVSLSGNGYQKLPSGLIIQWGQASTNASGLATITFPMAFPTYIGTVVPSIILAGPSTTSLGWTSGSNSGCSIYAANSATGAALNGYQIRWIAIGY